MTRRFSSLFLVAILACSGIISGCLGGEPSIPDDFNGDDIYPAVAVEPFDLVSHDGTNYSSENFDGKVVIVVFMFTRCPDVCPVVSANTKWLYSQLTEDEQSNVEVISITVDPWTDNITELATYKENMTLDWNHLTGEVDVLEPVWGNFDVGLRTVSSDEYSYQNNTDNTSGSDETSGRHHPAFDYLVDHSTGTILVDKNGYQRVWWGDVDWIPDLVLADVRELLSE